MSNYDYIQQFADAAEIARPVDMDEDNFESTIFMLSCPTWGEAHDIGGNPDWGDESSNPYVGDDIDLSDISYYLDKLNLSDEGLAKVVATLADVWTSGYRIGFSRRGKDYKCHAINPFENNGLKVKKKYLVKF